MIWSILTLKGESKVGKPVIAGKWKI